MCYPVLMANSQFHTITAFTWRVRGLNHPIFAPAFAPRSSSCKTGARTSRPAWGLSQPHFNSITGALSAERPREVRSRVPSGSGQLNPPGPPSRFRQPFQRSLAALLSLSAREERKAPQLPVATAPGATSGHLATDGEGSPRYSPRFDIFAQQGVGKGVSAKDSGI